MNTSSNHKPPITHPQFIIILLIAAIVLGVGARVTRYAANLNLWGDESYVAVNIVERTPAQLMQPLDNRQVAPPMWLWAARGCWKAFDALDAMRLPAFIGGLATIGVFTLLARRVLKPSEMWWAVALFAASYPLIRYSVEVKPYATDALAATIILTCVAWALVKPAARPELSFTPTARPLWLLALLLPVLIWLSYPAAVVTFGAGTWAIILLIRHRHDPAFTRLRLPVFVCIVAAAAAAVLLGLWVVLPARHQADGFMADFWKDGFPPITQPWRIPLWLLHAHTGKMMGYPFGDKNFGSTFTTVLFLAGVVALWLAHRRGALWLMLSVMFAAMAMAFAGVYPYGVHVRIMLFLAPVICLLAGIGIHAIADWVGDDIGRIWRVVLAIIFLVIPVTISTDAIRQGLQQNKLADVAGTLRWLNRLSAQLDAPIYCFNALDPHVGSGPKIEFELYMMTQLHRPVFDNARVPDEFKRWVFPGDDLPGPGGVFFAVVYDHTSDSARRSDAIEAWQDRLSARARLIAHRNAMMELDSGGTLHVFQYEVQSRSQSTVPSLLPLIPQ